ncbi:hypothetical protein BJF92_19480 [Rhizobium rhizosphaerae]|uniref:Uncharacterized protein n=1 Tax=Xaviernesmea rhizosphaerae TaxID=1672749 RepID=A0A1Q9AL66_9HYPH|nr:hypothetical protein [Xaviernesmea rhizosphaerae]OLP56016.1 hypothetical protein BJF92_19480 [Xaviernesmea rhizosphaerae]
MARKTLDEGYLAVVKAAIRSAITAGGFSDPFAGAKITIPKTAASPRKATPIGFTKMNGPFRAGIESGLMEDIMLPLLGHLTSRRLGLLIHLRGTDIREQYPDVWVGQVTRLSNVNGTWTTIPVKTQDSERYFVLHDFLKQIGFIDWAISQESNFLFPNIMNLKDPSKSGSSYMQRLFVKAGIKPKSGGESNGRREVFHSLRSGNIQDMRESGSIRANAVSRQGTAPGSMSTTSTVSTSRPRRRRASSKPCRSIQRSTTRSSRDWISRRSLGESGKQVHRSGNDFRSQCSWHRCSRLAASAVFPDLAVTPFFARKQTWLVLPRSSRSTVAVASLSMAWRQKLRSANLCHPTDLRILAYTL